jgi:Cof subfamily protein (haloacid dehalogenase superfamily)
VQKFKGYLICTDIDGTLVNSKGELSANNLAAIKEFQLGGGLFTVSTGRMPEYVLNFPFLPNAPVISVNGTVIYDIDNRKVIREFPLDCYYDDVIVYIGSRYADVIRNYEVYTHGDWTCVEDRPLASITEHFREQKVYKILFRFFNAEDAVAMNRDLDEKFGDRFLFDRSWLLGVEMHIKNSGKGHCVKLLKEEMCSDIHTAIAIGDFENDITMLKVADIGFATQNAPDNVKQAADRIAPSNDDDAICYVINTLLGE